MEGAWEEGGRRWRRVADQITGVGEKSKEIGVVISPTFNARSPYQHLQPTKHKSDNTGLLLATQPNTHKLY